MQSILEADVDIMEVEDSHEVTSACLVDPNPSHPSFVTPSLPSDASSLSCAASNTSAYISTLSTLSSPGAASAMLANILMMPSSPSSLLVRCQSHRPTSMLSSLSSPSSQSSPSNAALFVSTNTSGTAIFIITIGCGVSHISYIGQHTSDVISAIAVGGGAPSVTSTNRSVPTSLSPRVNAVIQEYFF